VPRIARPIDQLPEEVLKAAAAEFMAAALKALEGQIPIKRELAHRLGWPDTTLGGVLRGCFTFDTWPKICRALERDPVDELVRGREELRREQDRKRENAYQRMRERVEVDTMVAFYRTLSFEERIRVARQLAEVDTGPG
jgi:hypothetical protein